LTVGMPGARPDGMPEARTDGIPEARAEALLPLDFRLRDWAMRYDPMKYLAPSLLILAATEAYFWHLGGGLLLVTLVAAVFAHVAAHKPVRAVVEVRSVAAIVRNMGKKLADADEQKDGVIALLDATRSSAPDRAACLDEIVRERGVHAVCEALVQHANRSSFVVPAFQLLHRLLLSAEQKGKIVDAFNVDSLMGSVVAPIRVWASTHLKMTLEAPPDPDPDPVLLCKGFSVLALLVDAHVLMQDGAAESRLPELVVRTLSMLAKFAGALEQVAPPALRCLFHTCFRHAEGKHQFAVEADGLRVLLRVLTLLPNSRETQLHGMGLLFDSLSEMRGVDLVQLRADAVEWGVLAVLADARRNFSDVETIVMPATQMEQVLGKLALSSKRKLS